VIETKLGGSIPISVTLEDDNSPFSTGELLPTFTLGPPRGANKQPKHYVYGEDEAFNFVTNRAMRKATEKVVDYLTDGAVANGQQAVLDSVEAGAREFLREGIEFVSRDGFIFF